MDNEFIRRLQMQNMAAAMMKEMPESRHNYKAEGLPLEGFDPVFAEYDIFKINRFRKKHSVPDKCKEA